MVRLLRWGSLRLALAGCADLQYTSSYPAPPEAFAQHDAGHPFFDLPWTLEREEGRVVVQRIVTASRAEAIQDVTVEVVGVDAEGKVLSRALGTTYGRRLISRASAAAAVPCLK